MTAATSDRDVPWREAVKFAYPAKGGVTFWVGALVAIDNATGLAMPCTGAATQTVVGVNQKRLLTTGCVDGALMVEVRRGLFRVKNDAANAYTLKDVGTVVHALDDTSVSKAPAAAAVAGELCDIESSTGDAWVQI